MLPLFTGLFVYGYIVTPALAVYSWIRWWRSQRRKSRRTRISLLGLAVASTALGLGIASVAASSIHHSVFLYLTPKLRPIYVLGLLVSGASVLIASVGALQSNPIRLKAVVVAVGAVVFWFLAGSGQ